MEDDEYKPLSFGDNDGNDGNKERRFSVHDVDPTDNIIKYGQPDNEALIQTSATRIASVDDDDNSGASANVSRSNLSVHSDSQADDETDAVFIAENVDNNDDYVDTEPVIYDTNTNDDTPNDDDLTRRSKEHTPDATSATDNNNNNSNYHYRHPSLPAGENTAYGDDDDDDGGHGRNSTSLIHDDVDSDQDPQMTPFDEEKYNSGMLISKNITSLHEYWCHSSEAIGIEEDTDAKLLREKQNSPSTPSSTKSNLREIRSGSVINKYTRPLICKISQTPQWVSVFGNGIISDTHDKYLTLSNGDYIEWIVEVMDITAHSTQSSILIGISSDLIGDTKEDMFCCNNNGSSYGFGFDNLGNIHVGQEVDSEKKDALHFEQSRDVIHLILDYSNLKKWKLFAKIGDVEEDDYDNLEKSCFTKICSNIKPGSYRLAVSMFSVSDALVIESCKIHGCTDATFFQELKSVAAIAKDSKNNGFETIHEATNDGDESDDNLKQGLEQQDREEPPKDDTVEIMSPSASASAPTPDYNRMATTVIKQSSQESTTPKTLKAPVTDKDVVESDNENENEDLKQSEEMNITAKASSELANENEKKIKEQLKTIEKMKKKIKELQEKTEAQQKEIDLSSQNEDARAEKNEVEEYKEKATVADDGGKDSNQELIDENDQLKRELTLAKEREQSWNKQKIEMQDEIDNAIDSKMKLIESTSSQIEYYRQLINDVAQQKFAISNKSQLQRRNNNNNKNNGYYGNQYRNAYY